jgi:GNAT superfamily N-acetyltransferase
MTDTVTSVVPAIATPSGGSADVSVVAAEHPSLDGEVAEFVAGLRAERRFFGPSGSANPKPFPSLIAQLEQAGGFRLAAMSAGRVIGLVRVDEGGSVFIAVASDHRGHGIGVTLLNTALERAANLRYGRLVIRSSRRSRAVRRVGERFGCVVVDGGRGRTEVILSVSDPRRLSLVPA